MSYIYAQKLPSLQIIGLELRVMSPFMRAVANNYTLQQVLHSDIANADLIEALRVPGT